MDIPNHKRYEQKAMCLSKLDFYLLKNGKEGEREIRTIYGDNRVGGAFTRTVAPEAFAASAKSSAFLAAILG